jgi:rRNA small subunit pseudouridine methyltransferase Nep1
VRGRVRRGDSGYADAEDEESGGENGEGSGDSDEESFHGFDAGGSSDVGSRRNSGMQIDEEEEKENTAVMIANTATTDRPTKPLPGSSKTRKLDSSSATMASTSANGMHDTEMSTATTTATTTAVSSPAIAPTVLAHPKPTQGHPHPLPANPSLVPIQPRPPTAHSQSRRLIVVLEQACLEAYRVSGGSGAQSSAANGRNNSRRGGKGAERGGGEAKYALLNCDDHQGILAKTGRDIADARPDITHQVCFSYPFLKIRRF